jgi:hypothetical protein
MRALEAARPLGGWERMTAIMHHEFFGTGILVGCVRLSGSVNRAAFSSAWERLVAVQPALRARIVPTSGAPRLEVQSALSAPLPVRFEEGEWQAVMEEEMSRPFDSARGPLWRVACLEREGGADLVISLHHSIADGLSLFRLATDLLRLHGAEQLQPLAPKPSIEVALGRKRSVVGYILGFLRRGLGRIIAGQPRVAFSDWVPFPQRRTRHLFHQLSAQATSALVQRCREEKTTVHGALVAAQALAFEQVFAPAVRAEGKALVLSSHSAVSWRSTAGLDDRPLACDVSVPDGTLSIAPGVGFWDLARRCKANLEQSVQQSGHVPAALPFGLLRFLIRTGVLEAERTRRYMGCLSTTNLGVLECPTLSGPLTLEGFWFAVARRIGDFPLMLHALTLHGKLGLCFNYESPMLDAPRAQRFAALTLGLLLV